MKKTSMMSMPKTSREFPEPAKQQLTPEEGSILIEAFSSPAREPTPRMLEAVANHKRIMSETL